MPIYVAGPVLRTGTRQPRWVAECYRLIQDVARPSPRYQVLLPAAELLLESMDARGFTTELRRRIVGADKVIAVFLPDDQSTPIECALAAAAGKRVLLLHEAGAESREFSLACQELLPPPTTKARTPRSRSSSWTEIFECNLPLFLPCPLFGLQALPVLMYQQRRHSAPSRTAIPAKITLKG